MRHLLVAALLAAMAALAGARPLVAQTGLVEDAERLRNAGQFAQAVSLLESHLAVHPDDTRAARLLAETLYWLQEVEKARAVYEQALARVPGDDQLRLAYARMLVETGTARDARAILAPLIAPSGETPGAPPGGRTRADALTLLGTLAYWEGDLAGAKRLFEDALDANPDHSDAGRQLQEIRAASAPWVRVSPALLHDDQPLDRRALLVEAGWFATPLVPMAVRVEPARYEAGGAIQQLWAGELTIGAFAPRARLETELAGGLLRRDTPAGGETEWQGRAMAGMRLPRRAAIRARVERTAYLHTVASLATPVAVRAASGELRWDDPRGWLAEAAVRRQWYPDDNAGATAYAWMLAPLSRTPAADLHAGYAFSADHTRESRFVPAGTSGRYTPYYTPARLVAHAAIAAIALRPSPRATLRAGGSYAIRAREDAPVFTAPLGVPIRTFVQRSFTPWTARASLELRPREPLTVSFAVESGRTAFYAWTTARVSLMYRFVPAARQPSGAP
jgi:tetratricopeptide (TPR) repeat protein